MTTSQAVAGGDSTSIVQQAQQYLGTPYVFGAATGDTKSFDCSSFVQYLYGQYGAKLPRVAYDQFKATEGGAVSMDQARPGDLVFFKDTYDAHNPLNISHVAIYQGNGQFIGAQGNDVNVRSLDDPYWHDKLVAIHRVGPPTSNAATSPQQGTPAVASGTAPADISAITVQGKMDPQQFVDTLRPVAEAHSRQTGIPVEYYLAAAAHESGWGGSGNTLFGIKGAGATFATYEVEGGRDVPQNASFRTYPNADAAFSDFDRLVTSGRYAPAYEAFRKHGDAHQFWSDITAAGYATDKTWGDKIARMADGTIAPLLQGTTTTPGGTPMGRANESPFAPAEQPYTNTVDTSTQNVDTSTQDVADPWAAVNATLQGARDRLANLGQGAASAAAPVVGSAADTARGAVGDVLGAEAAGARAAGGALASGAAAVPAVTPSTVEDVRGFLQENSSFRDWTQPLGIPDWEDMARSDAEARAQGLARAQGRAATESDVQAQLEAARRDVVGSYGLLGAGDLQSAGPLARVAGAGIAPEAAQAGRAVADLAGGAEGAAQRAYTGTARTFERWNPARMDKDALFGRAAYFTDNPEVAGGVVSPAGEVVRAGYAQAGAYLPGGMRPNRNAVAAERLRAEAASWERAAAQDREALADPAVRDNYLRQAADRSAQADVLERSGPQVRAVDIPSNLRLFDAEAPLGAEDAASLLRVPAVRRIAPPEGFEGKDGKAVYDFLHDELGTTDKANAALRDAGYDGVRYNGGQRRPMLDAAGAPITHNAYAIFPRSVPKIRNAISGRAGGSVNVQYALAHGATTATGGLGGGLYGAATAPEGSTPEERRARMLKYGAIGVGLGLAAGVPLGLAAAKGGARAAAFTDPGVQAIADMHARAVASPSILSRLAAPFKDIGTQFEEQFLDDFARGNTVTTEARKALGVKGAQQTPRSIDFEALGALWRGRDAAGAQWVRDGLGKVYEHLTAPLEEQALNAVLKLRRDIEVANIRLAKGVDPADLKFSGGVTGIADAQAKLQSIEQQLGPQAWGRIQQAEAAFRAHMDSILDKKVASGLIDKDWAAWLKANHPNYSPSILADDAAAASTSTGKKLSVESHGVRRLSETGHAEDDLPPLTAAVVQTLKENARVMQNDAAAALAHALETAPSTKANVARMPNVKLTTGTNIAGGVPGTTVVGRQPPVHIPGTISWWEDGARRFLKVPDEFRPLVEGLQKDPQTEQAAGILVQGLKGLVTGPQKVARMFITQKNPIFPLINGQADMLVAGAQGVNPLSAMRGYGMLGTTQEITRLGGAATGWHGQGVQGATELQAALSPSGGFLARAPGDAAKIMRGALTLKPVEWYGNRVEWGPRAAAYRKALAAGATPERAALAARRVTLDFARAGAFVRKLNSWILFLNASVQGVAQIVRVARDNPKAAALFVAGINAATFASYEWNRQFTRPDGSRYYDDVPEYVRQTNLVVMIPGTEFTDKNGTEMLHYAAIPLRQLGAIAAPGLAAARAWERESPEDYGKFVATLGLRTLSPIQGETPLGVIGSVLPVGAGTAVELATNKDTYRGTDIIPERERGLPAEQQTGTHATSTARRIGGVLGVAPAQVQHVADTLGGTAQQLTGLADIAAGNAETGTDALYRSTIGRIYRDQGGQQRRDVGDVYEGGLDAAKQRAYDALKRTPEWQAAKDDKERAGLTRRAFNQVEQQYQQQPGVTTPDWAQPQRRDGPPKYDESKAWVKRLMQESGASDIYDLERQINRAVATRAKDRTALQRRLAYYAQYATPEYRRWAKQHGAAEAGTQRTLQGVATDAFAPASP